MTKKSGVPVAVIKGSSLLARKRLNIHLYEANGANRNTKGILEAPNLQTYFAGNIKISLEKFSTKKKVLD